MDPGIRSTPKPKLKLPNEESNAARVDSSHLESSTEEKTETHSSITTFSNDQPSSSEENKYIVDESSGSINTISVRFRPTNIIYKVCVHQNMTVKEIINDVCQQANMYAAAHCYLWFDFRELIADEAIFENGLYQTSNEKDRLPEVRLRLIQILEKSLHIGKDIFLASPEHINLKEIMNISSPSKKEDIQPIILKEIVTEIVKNTFTHDQLVRKEQNIFIPLPTFSKQSIDTLPTINVTIPLKPNQFDWNEYLRCLANDLEIESTDLIIVNVVEGSTIFKLKLVPKLTRFWKKIKKIAAKISIMILPKCEQFIIKHNSSNLVSVEKIKIEIENFEKNNFIDGSNCLSLDEIDTALKFCKRPALMNKNCWELLMEKNRHIHTIIMQSLQSCTDEYIIDYVSIIYNEKIYEEYQNFVLEDQNERVLFHGTKIANFDGIFEANFQNYFGTKRTDPGWYGQGIYFSSSPQTALNYAKDNSKMRYLLCSLVRLGKTLEIKDRISFFGKPMHSDYDSHYIQIRNNGCPIQPGETSVFDEYVIKRSEQIMPLYIIGLLQVSRFVIWRDAKITNEENVNLFKKMREKYAFNIYGCQTSVEALDILKIKLRNKSEMNTVVITNGADDGEGFVRDCRKIQPSLPITVYCRNKSHHQQWAATIQGPNINVTSSSTKVFNFITTTLQD
ncbi:hypothetical protein I4U23_022261 [Adineta vaga]|nr:hypothetical protein I4U23_022261 [Adineta vaga]